MDKITRSFFHMENIETREADNKRSIAGYAAMFDKLSVPIYDFREKIRAGAFSSSLKKNNVRALWNHNSDIVLGSMKSGTLLLNEDEKGLRFELELPDTQAGRDSFVSIKRGDVDGMSFGFRILKQEWDESNPKNVIRTLIEIDLMEISPTAFPAYPDTKVKARTIEEDYKEFQEESHELDKEKNIRALALMKNKLTIIEKENIAMLKDIAKMKRERFKLIEEMRSLTTAAEAREDKRMTEQEGIRWSELNKQVDQEAQEIERSERMNQLEMENASNSKTRTDSQEMPGKEKRFASFGEFLSCVIMAGQGIRRDERLVESRAATGLGTNIPSDGGFLVQTDQVAELLTKTYELAAVASRCRRIPVSSTANGLTMNAIDETSRATGSRWGGVRAYWAAEADTAADSKPKFRQMELKLKKLMGFCYLTDEVIQDAIAMESIVMQAFSEEFAWLLDNAIINEDGSGKPLGIMQSPALVTVAKESGQTAATIKYENILKMWSRLWARSRANAVWFINQDCEPQLSTMSLVVGTGGVPVYLPAGGISGLPYNTLYGRPVIPIEQCQTVGMVGDLILSDFSQYLLIDKGGMQQASSIHVRFMNDENVLRFIYRIDGQPIWNAPLTPAFGSNTLSPFVVLQTRS